MTLRRSIDVATWAAFVVLVVPLVVRWVPQIVEILDAFIEIYVTHDN